MRITTVSLGGLVLLSIITCFLSFSKYSMDINERFEERRLNLLVNSGTDAAALMMRVETDDLEMDYIKRGQFSVQPEVAKNAFASILSKAYGIYDNENRNYVMKNYVPIFIVAGYDGYYKLLKNKDSGNIYFSNKLPYVPLVDKSSNRVYTSTISYKGVFPISNRGEIYEEEDSVEENEQIRYISNLFSDTINWEVKKVLGDKVKGKFLIPQDLAVLTQGNIIDGTTVFAYINNFDLAYRSKTLQSFSIGGSRLELYEPVVSFDWYNNGVLSKGYCYYKDVPDIAFNKGTYDSAKEAAEDGYYYYHSK